MHRVTNHTIHLKVKVMIVTSNKKNPNNKKKHYRKHTFKFAECVSLVDIMEKDVDHVALFFHFVDKLMGVRESEITSN